MIDADPKDRVLVAPLLATKQQGYMIRRSAAFIFEASHVRDGTDQPLRLLAPTLELLVVQRNVADNPLAGLHIKAIKLDLQTRNVNNTSEVPPMNGRPSPSASA